MSERTWAEVGEVIRSWRVAEGWTQEEAVQHAKRRGGKVSVANWRVFERGGRESYRELTLAGIASAFGMTAEALHRIKAGEDPAHLKILAADWDDDPSGGYDAGRRVTMGDREWAYVQEHAEEMRTLEQAILHLLRYLSAPNRHRVLEYIVALGQEEEGHRLLTLEEWRDRVIYLLAEQEVRAEQSEAPTTNDLVTPEYEKAKKRPRKRPGEAARDVG